jgi:surfactin synthase thioesterase subunit
VTGPRWLTELRGAEDTDRDLYCFPAAGAGSLGYRSWLPHLCARTSLSVAVLPGRDHRFREPPARGMHEVAGPLAAAIAQRAARPYVLFGHSMGALVAHAVVRAIRQLALPGPRALVVFGAHPPDGAWPDQDAHLLGEQQFAALIRRIGGTPDAVFADPRQRQLVLDLLRADFELAGSYPPQRDPLRCPVVALYGTGDPRVTERDARAWRPHAAAGFRCAAVPGGHFAPSADPAGFVRALESALLEGELAAARAGTRGEKQYYAKHATDDRSGRPGAEPGHADPGHRGARDRQPHRES